LKKVLIIAYYWGTRIPGLAKYLPEFGWQPIILTAPMGGNPDSRVRIIETPYRDVLGFWKRLFRLNPNEDLRRGIKGRFGITSKKSLMDYILTFGGEIVNYPDGYRGWKPFAIKAGDELLQQEDIQAMISSSSPITCHLIARELKIKHKIPWVADFRDLWTQNHNYSYSRFRKLFDRRLELKTLSEADALVTVSQTWADKLGTLHKGKTAYAITNGFDPEIVNIPPANLTAKFTITYTGTILVLKHDPLKLFAALRDLISNGTMNPDEIEVRFYGTETEWLGKEIEQYRLSDIVRQYGQVPKDVALQKQRESQLLLQLCWEGREKAAYSGKLFEYLAAQRPILATGSGNDMTKELLNETKAGSCGQTVEEIKSILNELYLEYKNMGRVIYKGDKVKINKYSYQEMAKRFTGILDHLTQK